MQKELTSALEDKQDGNITDTDYDAIQGKCHTLRNELTCDLLSRREAPLIRDA